jgi:hypothetical protein
MAKKTGHYTATPTVIADARAASGRKLQFFQSDGEGVFASKETEEMLMTEKVRHLWGAPYDSNTNPFVERARRTVFEGTCTSLLRSGAPSNFWGEAENHKIFTINVLPAFKDPDTEGLFLSRKNLLEGNKRKFNLEHLMAFGTAATCYVPVKGRKDGKSPSQRRFFRGAIVGYAENTPAYRVWDLAAKTIRTVSYNFTITHEGFYPFKDKTNWTPDFKTLPVSFFPTEDGILDAEEWAAFGFDEEDATEVLSRIPVVPTSRTDSVWTPGVTVHEDPDPVPVDEKHMDTEPVVVVHTPALPDASHGYDLRERRPLPPEPPRYRIAPTSNFMRVDPLADKLLPSAPEDKPVCVPPPKTLREAMLSPWWPQYKEAAKVEIEGHEKNGTWELVPISDVPKGRNILRGKFVFDDKRGENGKIVRYKARFVAMGFTQKYGVDYSETFAAVVISKSFRMMLVILNEDPTYEMEHWDVKMAFTKASVEEELYMHQPEGFEKKQDQKCLYVCRLRKALYGLKQSARNWQQLVRDIFHESGFVCFLTDPCLFFTKRGDAWCLVAVHVDDIFPLYNQSGKLLRDEIFSNFQKYVEIDSLGAISWALKTHIQRDRQKGIIKISQDLFATEFLDSKGVKASAAVSTPTVTSGPDLVMEDSDVLDEELKDFNFQSEIGSLWWLANISRPDIFYAVHRCSKWQNKPSRKLWRWLLQIKRYLVGTISLGIIYQRSTNTTPLLSGFVDAAFAAEDGSRSRLGWFYMFKGNLISWTSENPKRIMTSSTEVECRGLSQFAKENLWQRQLQLELGLYELQGPTTIYEDNTASITMSLNPGVPHKRSKHFGIEWAMFKEAVELGEVLPVYIKTEEQPADMLTKPLAVKKFEFFRDRVMGDAKLQLHFGPIKASVAQLHVLVEGN